MATDENPKKRAAVLFDLDGVTVSTEEKKSAAHIQTVQKLGGVATDKLEKLYEEIMGLSHGETRDRFLECAGIAATPNVKRLYTETYRKTYALLLDHLTQVAPGVAELLERLTAKGYRIGLVSSARLEEIEKIFRQTHIGKFFDVIVSRENVANPKPAPEPYLKALELLNLDDAPHLAIAFEDTSAGITSAKNAGLTVFAVRHGMNSNQDLSGAERIFHSLEDQAVLSQIEQSSNQQPA